MSFASRIASSASRTFITGRIGPKVSSVITFIVWSTPVSTVGSKNWPGAGAPLPAHEHLGALVDRVLHVVLDLVRSAAGT